MGHPYICPSCGHRTSELDGKLGFTRQPKGCSKCGNSGYKGRMGIHELLLGTDEMKRLIQKRKPVEDMRKQAMRDGMTTLLQDGIQKVIQGVADFKQVRAVCIK